MEVSFDLKQEYSYGPNYSWLRVLVDGVQISPDFNPSTSNSDPCTKVSVDLSAYAGTNFVLSIQSSCNYSDATAFVEDNAYVDNLMIREIPLSAMAMASANTICAGDTVMLYGMAEGGNGTYTSSWSPSTNLMGATNDTALFVATTSEDFIFTVNDGSNSVSDTVSVTVNATPTISFSTSGDPMCNEVEYVVNNDVNSIS